MTLLTFSVALPAYANDDIKDDGKVLLHFSVDETIPEDIPATTIQKVGERVQPPFDDNKTLIILEGPTHPYHPNWVPWAITTCKGVNPDGTHNYMEPAELLTSRMPHLTKYDTEITYFYLWLVRYKYGVYDQSSHAKGKGGKVIVGKGEAKTEDDVIDDSFGYFDHMSLQMTAQPDKGYEFVGWTCVKPGGSIETSPILSKAISYNYTPENGGGEDSEEPDTLYALFKVSDKSGSDQDASTVVKVANPLKLKGKKIVLKSSALKKKARKLAFKKVVKVVRKGRGKMSYKLAKVTRPKFKKYFKVNAKTGKLTVKKGLKKGTYKIKIKVKATGNARNKACTKMVTCKIKVK